MKTGLEDRESREGSEEEDSSSERLPSNWIMSDLSLDLSENVKCVPILGHPVLSLKISLLE